jgi:hypothetical protein
MTHAEDAEHAWQAYTQAITPVAEHVKRQLLVANARHGLYTGPQLDAAVEIMLDAVLPYTDELVLARIERDDALEAQRLRDAEPPPPPAPPAPFLITMEPDDLRGWLRTCEAPMLSAGLAALDDLQRQAVVNQLTTWARMDGNRADVLELLTAWDPRPDALPVGVQ